MITFPKAKINIGLQILGKRDDGFHEIQTIMYPIGWHDSLEIIPSSENTFSYYGLPVPPGGTNTCETIHQKMQAGYGISNIDLHLTKGIPMGAGLGGGSADAAYTAKTLNHLFDLKLSDDELETLCAEVGSDCPFFVKDIAQFCEGRGERLSTHPLDLTGFFLVAVNPGIHIATGAAYQNADHSGAFDHNLISRDNIDSWSSLIKNDFEIFVFSEHSDVAQIKDKLLSAGAVYSAMSGSGSTVFGLFREQQSLSWPSHYQVWSEKL
jgi:4-diphosphocytidyl-2-C-methyl-D-erythritol kinase